MFSTTADHALRAVLFLAPEFGRRFVCAVEIADATGAPRNYLAKTLNALVKAGVVTSRRGPAGGFALAVPPAEICLTRIIDLFDEPRRPSRCLLGTVPCNVSTPCAAHRRWSEILHARRLPLSTTTVADLLGAA